MKEVVKAHGFPVKIQIPLAMIIKATVTFNKFSYLENNEQNIKEIFEIPDYCEYMCRKEGMKTLTNKKKRLAFANIATWFKYFNKILNLKHYIINPTNSFVTDSQTHFLMSTLKQKALCFLITSFSFAPNFCCLS